MIYRAVVQDVLLLVLESWVLLVAMEKIVEGEHTGFLRQITGTWTQQTTVRMRVTPSAGGFWEAEVTQSETTYIGCRQGTVAQWVAL